MAQLYGKRIRLRAAEREDIPAFLRWINDPEVTENLFFAAPIARVEEEKWYEDMMGKPPSEHILVIEVRDVDQAENYRTIGNCQFHDIDWRNRSSEVGILIDEKRFWNQGYGTETMHLLLQHEFNTLNLHRIWLQVISKNKWGIRAYEKAGFQHEGKFRQAHFQYGQYYDVDLMSVIKEEWQSKNNLAQHNDEKETE
ncbi:MAG: GNAT family protein [Chloroflexota bacterium]|nr:GNAT family protein [Chloroflexota bacterium]